MNGLWPYEERRTLPARMDSTPDPVPVSPVPPPLSPPVRIALASRWLLRTVVVIVLLLPTNTILNAAVEEKDTEVYARLIEPPWLLKKVGNVVIGAGQRP